jgi:hypothetical protein
MSEDIPRDHGISSHALRINLRNLSNLLNPRSAGRAARRHSVAQCRGRSSAGARHKSGINNLGQGVLGRNELRIPRIAMNIPLATAHGIRPTRQVKHRDEDLLARDDRYIGVLIVVEILVLGHDMVDPGGNVAIESATPTLQRNNMMAANYRHIGGRENRLGRHYSRFSASWPAALLADQSLGQRKSRNGGSNRRS